MSTPIIQVESLSKRYIIGHQSQKGDGLRHAIENAIRTPMIWMRSRRQLKRDLREEFWALRDVDFEIKQGEVVGIIGRNGAGKSTLLKILSRITEPTSGRITIKGRVASLLEVGTGFHPELTGRENIFLNGAILGMARIEIKRKFDEIVAFSGVEKFLDTPVKRYSSGMYVRLAFAVAAHLEPDILIVDEVLAVGDTEFQKKCLGKMSEVAQGGRTVLFVSHNMASLSTLCTRGIVLDTGCKQFDGTINEAVDQHINSGKHDQRHYQAVDNGKPFQIVGVSIPSLSKTGIHVSGKPLRIRTVIRCGKPIKQGCLSIQVTNHLNISVLHFRAYDRDVFFGTHVGLNILECELSECWLNIGSHRLNLFIADPPGGEAYEALQGVCQFQVAVLHATTRFEWRSDACCYLQDEHWISSDQLNAATGSRVSTQAEEPILLEQSEAGTL